MSGSNLIIVLPEDETRRKQLEKKLQEYKDRWDPYKAPELQMGTICKITVLETLSRDYRVDAESLRVQMLAQYGSGFDPRKFAVACGVIDNYCKTGGEGNYGGTGLPN